MRRAKAQFSSSEPAARRSPPRNVRRPQLPTDRRSTPGRLAPTSSDSRAHHARALDPVTPTPSPVVVAQGPKSGRRRNDPRALAPTPPRVGRAGMLGLVLLALVASAGVHRSVEGVPLPEYASGRAIMELVEGAAPAARNARARVLEALERSSSAAELPPSDPGGASDDGTRPVKLRREGHVSIPGGILVLPDAFQPEADGVFDLYVHFHGNTAVVRESAEAAGLDAAVVIVNLGTGSLPYEEYYSVPGTYEELLDATVAGLERRGLAHPRIRRVALGAWSAGYGAVSTIVQVSKKRERLDAVLVFDGIHCGWEGGALNPRQMKPFSDLGVLAAKGDLYFGITHSTIDPKAYASTTATADYVLAAAGAERHPLDPESDAPTYLELESMKGAVAKKLEKRMEPVSEAQRGDLHVIGYRGDTKEHHMAHLFQMGSTLLPELVARWKPQP